MTSESSAVSLTMSMCLVLGQRTGTLRFRASRGAERVKLDSMNVMKS